MLRKDSNQVQCRSRATTNICLYSRLKVSDWFLSWASQVTSVVNNPPSKQETWVRSLGQEDPLSRKWQSAPIFLPGQFHKQRSLAGYTPWGYKESDATEHDFYLTWFFIWFLSYTCELIQIFNYIMCCPINTALQLFYIQPGCQIELNGVFLKPIKLKNIFPWLVFFTYWLLRVCKLRKVVKFIC